MKQIFRKCTAALCAITCLSAMLTAPASAASSSKDVFLRNYATQVLILLNEIRVENNLNPFYTTDALQAAATERSEECLTEFAHTRPDGSSCFTILDEYDIFYMSAGENIAYGQQTPQQVVNSWMASEGHRNNILSTSYSYVGIGVAEDTQYAWVNLFVGGAAQKNASIPSTQSIKGDADYDGAVTIQDAFLTLTLYARKSAGLQTTISDEQFTVCDIDKNDIINIQDAFYILLYYANRSSGITKTWGQIVTTT